jgi:hypothetical protein
VSGEWPLKFRIIAYALGKKVQMESRASDRNPCHAFRGERGLKLCYPSESFLKA